MNTAHAAEPGAATAAAGTTYQPSYSAPTAHASYVAPASTSLPLAPAGRLVIPAPEQSSGVGIHADAQV